MPIAREINHSYSRLLCFTLREAETAVSGKNNTNNYSFFHHVNQWIEQASSADLQLMRAPLFSSRNLQSMLKPRVNA